MHLFGALGSMMFIIGFFAAGFIGCSKLYHMYNGMRYSLVTNNPWFYISLTTMILGTQLFLAGFLGEIILQTKNNEKRYKVSQFAIPSIL
jgi:choline-glycine betaine transporter